MALLGISVEEETDETKPLSAYYAEKAWEASGKVPVNFLEVMASPGGCQNGPCSLDFT